MMLCHRLFILTTVFTVGLILSPLHAQSQTTENTALPFNEVTPERLLNAEDEPQNWLMYSGSYKSQLGEDNEF